MGHHELIVKRDGEPSSVALKEAINAERQERIVLEESPVGESKSNGGIETAIQQVQGHIRTIKDGMEAIFDKILPEDSALIPWW